MRRVLLFCVLLTVLVIVGPSACSASTAPTAIRSADSARVYFDSGSVRYRLP